MHTGPTVADSPPHHDTLPVTWTSTSAYRPGLAQTPAVAPATAVYRPPEASNKMKWWHHQRGLREGGTIPPPPPIDAHEITMVNDKKYRADPNRLRADIMKDA